MHAVQAHNTLHGSQRLAYVHRTGRVFVECFSSQQGGKKSRESERETVENGTKAFTAAIMDYDNL